MDYVKEASLLKILGEPTRLQILHMLTNGELCACDILEELSISQPTLSHHMKMLMECGLVTGRKDATWMRYSLNLQRIEELQHVIEALLSPQNYRLKAGTCLERDCTIERSI